VNPSPSQRPRFSRQQRQLAWGLLFLLPNLLGFLAFDLIPLMLSLVMAFSNWDLRLHSKFQRQPLKYVGLDHFIRLVSDENFWHYLGNTLFFMIGLPLGIVLSLLSAIILTQDLRGGSRKGWLVIVVGAVFVGAVVMLASVGMGATGLTIVLAGMFGMIFIGGSLGGQSVYRTLFYIPNFTAGVATMLLWKKMYNPVNGPINVVLDQPVAWIGKTLGHWPQPVMNAAMALLLILAVWLLFSCIRRFLRQYRDGELGVPGLLIGTFFLAITVVSVVPWLPGMAYRSGFGLVAAVAFAYALVRHGRKQELPCKSDEGVGSAFMLSLATMVGAFVLAGLGLVLCYLPAASVKGLAPPNWLQDPSWAKPAMMFMGLWGAVGSQTMLLYIAALTNVPGELYEAADLDGASPTQRFWNVTWPQLAPTTFFVIVMGVIGGLQSGFETAYVMTRGGPAGSTTTLAYFIYTEGFETGRLGFSSAVSWTMFLMVIVVTLFNWKFGNRYVND